MGVRIFYLFFAIYIYIYIYVCVCVCVFIISTTYVFLQTNTCLFKFNFFVIFYKWIKQFKNYLESGIVL